MEAFKRLDVAIDAYFNDPQALAATSKSRGKVESAPSTSKLNTLFDKYKGTIWRDSVERYPRSDDVLDPSSDEITIDGTINLCEDLEVDPEDVIMLAVAYELKSPRVGEWTRKGWLDGWKALG